MRGFTLLPFVFMMVCAITQEESWQQFKKTHKRSYRNLREHQMRYNIFLQNLDVIQEHNRRYEAKEETHVLGITKFADLTHEEFKQTLSYTKPTRSLKSGIFTPTGVKVPDSIDWRKREVVSKVKDQLSCNACWAFSATGALESQYAIKHGSSLLLSEQELIDCAGYYGSVACRGGRMEYAFEYVEDNGISSEENYPFHTIKTECVNSTTTKTDLTVEGYTQIAADEGDLKEAVAVIGPISAAINANGIQFYAGGVFNASFCSHELDHAVLVVGYGTTEENVDYWIVKNSWGTEWGEEGYIKMVRGANLCGIDMAALYPNVS